MSHLLGIDVGTGGTRAIVIDARGRIIGSATDEHVAVRLAADRVGRAGSRATGGARPAARCARRSPQRGVSGDDITAVGFSGQMHGSVLLDDRGEVVRPALIWCDQRTDAQCREITETVGAARLIELTSNPALTGFTLPKLLWVREHEPQAWARVRGGAAAEGLRALPAHRRSRHRRRRRLGHAAVRRRRGAGGRATCSTRWSSTPRSCRAAFESPEVTGTRVAPRAPRPRASGRARRSSPAAAIRPPAPSAWASCAPGAVSATIGTSGVVFAATDRPALDPQRPRPHLLSRGARAAGTSWASRRAAGLSLRWFRDQFGAGADDGRDPYERLTEEAARVPPGADGVLWAPYLMGERTPHLRPARARRAGRPRRVAHARRTSCAPCSKAWRSACRTRFTIFAEMQVPVAGVRLGGGGARSALWRQIQADVYGYPVEIVEAEEGAAYGAALLAGVGGGVWRTVEEACDARRPRRHADRARRRRSARPWRGSTERSARSIRRCSIGRD